MFEKLLTLLLHGKGALVAGVLVAGTAGAVISGTINGADFSLTVKPAASSSTTTSNVAATTPSPLAAAPLLSNSSATNSTSTSGDTASNCSEAAHLRNAANLAARVVWTQGRAALDLLASADKGSKKDLESFKKGLDAARKDAQTKIQHEWQTVACAGKGADDNADEDKNDQSTSNAGSTTNVDEEKDDQSTSNDDEDKNDDDSKTSTTSTSSKTVLNAPKTATPTPKPAVKTTGTTTQNSVQISFDTSKLGRYATFIDDEVTAVNQVLTDAAAAADTTQTPSTKKDHEKKNGASKNHDGRGDENGDD